MDVITREKCITEVFIGNDYTYVREADESNEESRTLIKKFHQTNKNTVLNNLNDSTPLTLIQTNRPAQYNLFRTIFTFYGTEKGNFAYKVYDKFVKGDFSYIDDLEPLIKKQLEKSGLKIVISSSPLQFYHKKINLEGLNMNKWFSDIRTELNKYDVFEFEVLRSPEKYMFPTNLK